MADLSLRTPEPLVIDITSTSMAATWEAWLDQLEMYFVAANIADPKRQKALLLYCGGNDLLKIHRTLNDDKETYNDTKTLLDAYFIPKYNLTFERNKFYTCVQTENETIAAYITKLKDKALTCKFDEYNTDNAIMDQVIHKCISNKLRRRLLREPDLTLEKLVRIAHAAESSEQQAVAMEQAEHSLNKISFRPQRKPFNKNTSTRPRKVLCYGCGENGHVHGSNECTAKGKRCNYCKKLNHLAAVCFKNPNRDGSSSEPRETNCLTEADTDNVDDVKQVHLDLGSSNDEYVFTLGASRRKRHDVTVQVGEVCIPLMIDSGAPCIILKSEIYDRLYRNILIWSIYIQI